MKKLNLFTITFQDNVLEQIFIKSAQDRTLYQGRIAILVGIFVYLLCGLLDQWFVPPEISDKDRSLPSFKEFCNIYELA